MCQFGSSRHLFALGTLECLCFFSPINNTVIAFYKLELKYNMQSSGKTGEMNCKHRRSRNKSEEKQIFP